MNTDNANPKSIATTPATSSAPNAEQTVTSVPNSTAPNAIESGNASDPTLPDPQRLARSLERHRAQFSAVPTESLIDITTDIAAAAMLVLKHAPNWAPLRSRIAALPEVDQTAIDNLESLAEAALQAHAIYLTTTVPPAEAFEVLKEGTALREALSYDAEGLVRRGLLPVGSLDEVDGQLGYRNVAVGLSALVTILQKHWSTLQGRTGVTQEELNRASIIAQKLFRTGAFRDARHPQQVEASLLRAQAFTVLSQAYDVLCRCLAFLVPQDAERLAPSMYQGRGGRPSATAKPPVAAAPTLGSSNGGLNVGAAQSPAALPNGAAAVLPVNGPFTE